MISLFPIRLIFNIAVCASFVVTASSVAQSSGQALKISYNGEGSVETEIVQMGEGASVTVLGTRQKKPRALVQDPSQSVRLLVRLKDQPLKPHLQELRAQQARDSKISPALHQKQYAKTAQAHHQLLQKSQAQVLGELRRKRILDKVHRQFFNLTNTLAITTTAGKVEEIRKLPQVAAVYPDNKVSAFLEGSVALVGSETVWALKNSNDEAVTGSGVTVAILDTGIDYRHPDLGGCLGTECKVVGGYNFVEGEDFTDPMDYQGHGTHVAGIVAAKGTLRGVAPDAKLYAFKVLDDTGSGLDSAIIAGLERAVDPDGDPLTDDQVDVINMSLGGWGAYDSPLSQAANNAMDAGIIVVVAAGNDGGYSSIGSPGNAERVITVGASDNDDAIAGFSSRGPINGQSYLKPELVAPGVNINSAAPGGGYAIHSGTSMAAPHVAGGAALLKQLRPELNAQEIKSLLIFNTKDIAEDIFTQGAGRMDLVAAADADLVISSPLLSFGYVDIEQALWQASLPFTFKNISSQRKTFAVTAPEILPAGTSFEAAADGVESLEPGESKEVDIAIRVNNDELPFRDSVTMHYESAFTLAADANTYRIPLAFIKAAKLSVDFGQAQSADVFIFSDTGDYYYQHYDFDCGIHNSKSTIPDTFYVAPGVYNAVVAFPGDSERCWIKNDLVFKENLSVTDYLALDIHQTEAKNSIAVADIVGELGQPINPTHLDVIDVSFIWFHAGANIEYFTGFPIDALSVARVSDLSNKFKVNVAALVKNTSAADDDSIHYLTQGIFDNGLSTSFNLALDTRNSGKVVVDYSDHAMLSEGVTLAVNAKQTTSLSEFIAVSMLNLDNTPRYKPFRASVYGQLATFELGEWYPDIWVSKYSDQSLPFWELMLVETGPMAFLDSQTFSKIKGPFSFRDTLVYQSKDNDLSIADSAYYFSSYIVYSSSFNQVSALDNSNCTGCFGLQKDQSHNLFHDLMPYVLRCNGEVLEQGETSGVYYFSALPHADCDDITLEFQMQTRLFGKTGTSSATVSLNTLSSPFFDSSLIESPIVDELVFLNDGKVSRILNGEKTKIAVKVGADRLGRRPASEPKVIMSYRLDENTDWRLLYVKKENDIYSASIPMVEGAHRGSLQLVVEDKHGNGVTQTLNSVFLLGKDAASLARKPPVFSVLPELIVEATAALTEHTLAAVAAEDIQDGVITATTENLGPYALGEHVILWTATNSAGMSASTTQQLVITDTTPPTVTAPASINIQATGTQTAVALGVATASDLVDGALTATPDSIGPFAVGVHAINWSATDLSGNVASTVQTVTVAAAPVPKPASNPAPTSKNSGGGVVSLWALILLLIGSLFGVFSSCTRSSLKKKVARCEK